MGMNEDLELRLIREIEEKENRIEKREEKLLENVKTLEEYFDENFLAAAKNIEVENKRLYRYFADEEYLNQFEDAEYNAQLKIYNEYVTLIKRVADLQIAINAAQENVDVVLYIVDINVDGGVNAGVMTDAAKLHEEGFAPLYSSIDESTYVEPAIFYLNEGVVKEKFENGKLATTKSLSKVASAINNAVNVLKSLQ